MKKLLVIFGLIGVLMVGGLGGTVLGVASTQKFAAGGAFGGEGGPLRRLIMGRIGRMLTLGSELKLTSDQRDQIRQIVQSHRTEIAAVIKPLVDKRRALRDATNASPVDETAIRAASADLTNSISDAAVLAARIKAQVRKVMTPQQAQKIDDFRKQSDSAVDEFVQELSNP